MTYVLAVLSHGDPGSPYAWRTLASFARKVTPRPEFVVFHHDGEGAATMSLYGTHGMRMTGDRVRRGYCGATSALWGHAVDAARSVDAEHVFWLEHDFVFKKNVNVAALGAILRDDTIAQVSLMRQPVNAQEKRRGRVLGHGDDGVTTELLVGKGVAGHAGAFEGGVWLRHSRYFTTNPSLMRTAFMRDHPFARTGSAPYDIECEGRYGADLRAAGFEFAVWGDGTPWVQHIGTRDGKGY